MLFRGIGLLMTALFCDLSGATFSPCKTYRYSLWRCWDNWPPLCFVLLNPSTADETRNDPTVERCQRRAYTMGFGGLIVVNLFAYRATDPEALTIALAGGVDIIGPDNDQAILTACAKSSCIIAGWGTWGRLNNRGATVRKMLVDHGERLEHLGLTAGGEPRHPLYVGYDVTPRPL